MTRRVALTSVPLLLALAGLACNATEVLGPSRESGARAFPSPTATRFNSTATASSPGESTRLLSRIYDASPALASSRSSNVWGDLLFAGLLEPPFDREEMKYRGDLDVLFADLGQDDAFLYLSLHLAEEPDAQEVATYGVEFDLDLDNRPDLLALARPTSADWEANGSLLVDENEDVGGGRPRLAEPNLPEWDGFEAMEDVSADPIWSRRDGSEMSVEIAIPLSVLGGEEVWVWRAWAWASELTGGSFEPNDVFDLEEAGSPDPRSSFYPLGALDRVDNTCLDPVGGRFQGAGPGYCGIETVIEGAATHPDDVYFGDDPQDDSSITLLLPTPTPTGPPPPDATETPEGVVFDPDTPVLEPLPDPVFIGPGNFLIPTATPSNQLVVVTPTPAVLVAQTPEELVATTPTPITLVVVTPTPIVLQPVDPTATPQVILSPQYVPPPPTQQIDVDPGDLDSDDLEDLQPTATEQINVDPGDIPPILP